MEIASQHGETNMQSASNDNQLKQFDYSIEKIASTFAEHADLADQHQEFVNKTFLEQNPGQELPPHMATPFNAAKAFAVMAGEISKLKYEIRDHLQFEHPVV